MEEQEKGNTIQPDVRKPRVLTLRLSYSNRLKHQLADAVNFVLEKLNFYPSEKFNASSKLNKEIIVLTSLNEELLTLEIKLDENKPEFEHITFYTDDCLRDYHKYIRAGVEFVSRPEYTKFGLRVDFMGHEKALYTLLEERTYTDS